MQEGKLSTLFLQLLQSLVLHSDNGLLRYYVTSTRQNVIVLASFFV